MAAGHERKTTGSYYTPSSLISVLLDSALDPVVAEAADKPTKEEAEKAILELSVVDPAAGSGHFLVAAAHRIAKRLAWASTMPTCSAVIWASPRRSSAGWRRWAPSSQQGTRPGDYLGANLYVRAAHQFNFWRGVL